MSRLYEKAKDVFLPEREPPFNTPIKCWTGGSHPADEDKISMTEFLWVLYFYRSQLSIWYNGNKVEPEEDIKRLFWNRARYDAHATVNLQ